MTTEFDEDTALVRDGDSWRGTVSPRWNIGAGANGGYLATFPLRAMLDVSPFPDPLSMTTHYLQRPAWEPLTVRARVRHAGRAHAFLEAEVEQAHGPIATAIAVFGTQRGPTADDLVTAEPPALAPAGQCVPAPTADDPSMAFVSRFDYRIEPRHLEAFWGTEPAPPLSQGWVRLKDRDLDAVAVPLFMDSFPPAMFAAKGVGLAPTLELTVHWRSRPGTGWHAADFRTRFLTGGYMEEDGELWDEEGRLVALSRQLARFTSPPAG